MKECYLACYLACYQHEPESPDTEPPFDWELGLDHNGDPLPEDDQDDWIEDDYVCPVHGRIPGGSECPRC